MIKISFPFTVLASLLLALVLSACGNGDGDTGNHEVNPTGTSPVAKQDVTITIGNLTDQTGVAAEPMSYIEMALDDVVKYYNDNNIIPGVKLKVADYDEKYDPAKDIPGYEKLKQEGADFIWTPVPAAVPVLQPRANREGYVLFTATANMEKEELEGGYVFSLGITPEYEAYTLLKWIAENDEDFPHDRPAKVGAAAWDDGYNNLLFKAAKDYVNAHPDQYEWDTTFLTAFSFNWATQAEELKDCDYVFVPTPPHIFMRDFRNAGGKAKFLGSDVPLAFINFFSKADLWEEVDGALFIRSSRWYNESGSIIDLTNRLLDEYHPAQDAASIRGQGCGYISVKHHYLMLDIVRKAIEASGPENFDSRALYDAATAWSFEYEGIPDFDTFDQTKRIAQNYYAVYEAKADQENIIRSHTEWLPQVTSP